MGQRGGADGPPLERRCGAEGVTGGLCVMVACRDVRSAAALAASGRYLVHVLDRHGRKSTGCGPTFISREFTAWLRSTGWRGQHAALHREPGQRGVPGRRAPRLPVPLAEAAVYWLPAECSSRRKGRRGRTGRGRLRQVRLGGRLACLAGRAKAASPGDGPVVASASCGRRQRRVAGHAGGPAAAGPLGGRPAAGDQQHGDRRRPGLLRRRAGPRRLQRPAALGAGARSLAGPRGILFSRRPGSVQPIATEKPSWW